MAMHNNLSEIESRCTEIINSPYMRRELPPELLKLRLLLTKVEKLTREDVPALVSEIKRLRSQNKRLEAEAEASHASLTSDSLDPIDLIEQIEQAEPVEPLEQAEQVEQVEPESSDHEAIVEATAESGR
jgi:ABC-type phosphate transport system auxiliary subunit